MTKLFFPIITILLLVSNIFFIGILKTNDAGINELFVKCEPSTDEFIFVSSKQDKDENRINYQKFILNKNIQDEEKSLLPLIMIQLMISSFIISISKMEFKRRCVVFIIHFLMMGIISVFAIPYLISINHEVMLVSAAIVWLLANLGFKYIITS